MYLSTNLSEEVIVVVVVELWSGRRVRSVREEPSLHAGDHGGQRPPTAGGALTGGVVVGKVGHLILHRDRKVIRNGIGIGRKGEEIPDPAIATPLGEKEVKAVDDGEDDDNEE
ncbi:hypothetical protein AGDE_16246 [Angomonas deanei]|nr:hypothetical protein AGDE_16246 [Angomonas deanei]|eukprot:EPY17458.1 hypothetical protein AGDE_16246 [Angomonas deanei]